MGNREPKQLGLAMPETFKYQMILEPEIREKTISPNQAVTDGEFRGFLNAAA